MGRPAGFANAAHEQPASDNPAASASGISRAAGEELPSDRSSPQAAGQRRKSLLAGGLQIRENCSAQKRNKAGRGGHADTVRPIASM